MMLRKRNAGWIPIALSVMFVACGQTQAQQRSLRPLAHNIVSPQTRQQALVMSPQVMPGMMPGVTAIEVAGVGAHVDILDQVATTTLTVSLKNHSSRRQEAELIMLLPDQAVVRGFTFQGAASEPTAQVLTKEEARRIYNQLVAKTRDPALLEFVGYNLVRSSVFPVEANGTQKVRLTYEHILEADGRRIDYALPRSESVDYQVPWQITVKIRCAEPISTVYSASHQLETVTKQAREVTLKTTAQAGLEPGPFRLSYLRQGDGVTASMICYPDSKVGGGYFLLLAGLPAATNSEHPSEIKREVTLVIDRSGSMNGEKIEQARQAALQVLTGLEDGEMFNIIIYSNAAESFAAGPVPKTPANEQAARKYLRGIKAQGGTNIHDALLEALRQKPTPSTLPVVLFLTDGLPTVGQTSEIAIRQAVMKSNPYERRIFTFGVDVDVNAPLLDKIADRTRAKSTYVLPNEDVEVKVGQVFKRLAGPVLADTRLEILAADGSAAFGRTRDLMPAKLPDLFAADQLVLLGQYLGEEPLTFCIGGNYLGNSRTFRFTFDFAKATPRNGFVPRLWASRNIAELIDAVRQLGADSTVAATDPRVKELVDEIVRLSTEFGILTEYTAFLAREGTNLENLDEVHRAAGLNFQGRALRSRAGPGAVNQSLNILRQKRQSTLNLRNSFFNDKLQRVSVANVQQVNDLAFYQRSNRWVDSRLVANESNVRPNRVIEFGSDEFYALARRLAQSGRQGSIALKGDILLQVEGQTVLIKASTR